MKIWNSNLRRARGSTLLAVFWLTSILGVALFAVLTLIDFETDLVVTHTESKRAGHFAEMGIAIGAHSSVERDDPLLNFNAPDGAGGYRCRLFSESDRFDINALLLNQDVEQDDKGWLREVFYDWGMELDEAQELVDALVDWVDAGELEELNGAEAPYYEDLGFPDRPFNRPFYSLDEMEFVRGMDRLEALNPGWKDFFTIWTQGGVDINEASPQMIALALDIQPEEAEIVTQTVRVADGILGTQDDAPFNSVDEAFGPSGLAAVDELTFNLNSHRLTTDGTTTRIESTGWSGEAKRRVTLIIRNREGTPTLLERREEVIN